MAFIEFNKIEIRYGDFTVMSAFDFKIEKGEIVTFFGPSGCGKTSLMKAVLGMVKVSKGNVITDGENALDYKSIISYTPQNNQLLPWLTVLNNIQLWAKENQTDGKNIDELLEILELTEAKDKLPKELSGGMARRAALARGLATKSEIICLDEVLVSVERRMRHKLMVNLRKYLKKNKITAILISHDYEEAVYMSDRVVVLSASPTEIIKIVNNVQYLGIDRDKSMFENANFKELSNQLIH